MNRRGFLAGLIGATLGSAALTSLPSPSGSRGERSDKRAATSAERRRSRFLNVVLRTQENQEVRFYDDCVKDKTVLINMMYTRCTDGYCHPTTANLARVQDLFGERLGRDIFIYSITLDPEHDTPEVLKKYAEAFGVKPGWYFLTGKKEDIERLRKKLGWVSPVAAEDQDISYHVGMLRFGIENLELWGGCPTLTRPQWIARYVSWLKPAGHPSNGGPKPRPDLARG